MYISILGRQPSLGIAELERVYKNVAWFSDLSATFDGKNVDIERLGGSQKLGIVSLEFPRGDWRTVSMKLVRHYQTKWAKSENKITLGISAYGFDRFEVTPRDVQKTGLVLKSKLKASEVSLRLVPNTDPALNTAVAHHNKLGLSENKVELFIIKGRGGKIIVAESIGSQNITALAARDQGRPKRDAFVGMLPPKLALLMINLAAGDKAPDNARLLDPFCGTGVILQEAALLGLSVYGTDLSEKMIRYSRDNLNWLEETILKKKIDWFLREDDAMTAEWRQPVDFVVAETYLGQPFSAPPSPAKLVEVRGNCNNIIGAFLKNIAPQLKSGTKLCLAIPAWKDKNGDFTHLPLISKLFDFGFQETRLTTAAPKDLLYYREDQVVARELLILTKI